MGNTRSQSFENNAIDDWWSCSDHLQERRNKALSTLSKEPTTESNVNVLDSRQEFLRKQMMRKRILEEKRKEINALREDVIKLRNENDYLRSKLQSKNTLDTATNNSEKFDKITEENVSLKKKIVELRKEFLKSETLSEKNNELQKSLLELKAELHTMNVQVNNFEKERSDYENHVIALKDVVKVSKQMLHIRENQLQELKQKVAEIESSLVGKEINVLSRDLREEYERQLRNIRSLRNLYEERQKADRKEKLELASKLDDAVRDLDIEKNKTMELEKRVNELEEDCSKKYDEIKGLQSNLGLTKAECREYQAQMSVINQLFSQILLGFNNSQDIDLDKLIKLLEENHDLLQNIVINEESNASAALPKTLLDLIAQINEDTSTPGDDQPEQQCLEQLGSILEEDSQLSSAHNLHSASEIVQNLPKVWKVLIELLSHQSAPVNILTAEESVDNENPCYKVVQTLNGPRLVLSVSQTFIRLKDLILEKKSLEKETGRLKQLNTHLETRLQDQEKRLELVSNELSKTWHVVGKMQKQHHQLHTQEKILRYELTQKRKLLNELKEELEYCREKWLKAREKNSNTEREWKELRVEFASRKIPTNDDVNNSLESGYSDERECLTDEEHGYETDVSDCNNKISSREKLSQTAKVSLQTTEENTLDELQTPSESPHLSEMDNHIDVPQENNSIYDVIKDKINEIESTPATSTILQDNSACQDTKCTEELSSVSMNQEQSVLNVSFETQNNGETSSSEAENSNYVSVNPPQITSEEKMLARDERLKRLEEQAKQLINQVTKTSHRSVEICAKLENLHETYGESSGDASERTNP